jgi:hypothetical protein
LADWSTMPDRLATRIVYAVLEVLGNNACIQQAWTDKAIDTLNRATDTAIEEVERLLADDTV